MDRILGVHLLISFFPTLFSCQKVSSYIEPQNLTWFSEFFLMDLSDDPECNLCSLLCSPPCTCSPRWGTCSTFSPSALTLSSPPPCTSSPSTCPWLVLVSLPTQSQRWFWIFTLTEESSFMWTAWLKCLFLCFLYFWIVSSWLWWSAADLLPSVAPVLFRHHEPKCLWLVDFFVIFN